MQRISLTTIGLCAACAALAGAGSAALADDPPTKVPGPGVAAIAPKDEADATARAIKCAYARAHDMAIADDVCAGRPPADEKAGAKPEGAIDKGGPCVDQKTVPADAAGAADTSKAAAAKVAAAKTAARARQAARR